MLMVTGSTSLSRTRFSAAKALPSTGHVCGASSGSHVCTPGNRTVSADNYGGQSSPLHDSSQKHRDDPGGGPYESKQPDRGEVQIVKQESNGETGILVVDPMRGLNDEEGRAKK